MTVRLRLASAQRQVLLSSTRVSREVLAAKSDDPKSRARALVVGSGAT